MGRGRLAKFKFGSVCSELEAVVKWQIKFIYQQVFGHHATCILPFKEWRADWLLLEGK